MSPQRKGRGRLSRSAEFDRVFRQGRSHAGRDLVLYVFPRGEDGGEPRLGMTVSRKVGGAVETALRRPAKRLRALFPALCAKGRQGAKSTLIWPRRR